MKAGQNVSITFGAYNPLSTYFAINVTSFTNQYLGPCSGSGNPTTFYMYAGHLTFSNLSHNTPLQLWNASSYPLCFRYYNSTLVFMPNSDRAVVYSTLGSGVYRINHTFTYSGFWLPVPGMNYSFKTFLPGQYTVSFNDTSGQRELHYFAVNP
jgi:hypothetical protein